MFLKSARWLPRLTICSLLFIQGCVGGKSDEDVSFDRADYTISTLFTKDNIVPFLVIGSGPAGLGAALYGCRDGVPTVIVEGPNPGGLLMKTTTVDNWPGTPGILGPDIIKQLRKQVTQFGATFIADTVTAINTAVWPYEVTFESGHVIHALTIDIATGSSPSKLGVPGEEENWGRGVTTCAVCDAHFYKGEDVVVVGGGDSAVEEALQLANHAKSITILVRKDTMRAAATMQAHLAEHPNIKVMYNVAVEEIIGNDTGVTGIKIRNIQTDTVSTLPIAGVFLAIGHTPNSEQLRGVVDIDDHGYVITLGKTQRTSVPGIAAAGEVTDNRYRQAASSFGDGSKAALDNLAFLRTIGFNPKVVQQLKKQGRFWKGATTDVHELDSYQQFTELSKDLEKPAILYFYRQDCPSCTQMMPVVSAVAQEDQSVAFFKVDADKALDLVAKYFVYQVPCLLVFNKGTLLSRYNKVLTQQELREFVEHFKAGGQ